MNLPTMANTQTRRGLNEITPAIQKTYDYGKFHFLPENRPVVMSKVRKIAASIEEDDQTPFRPIEVDGTFGIIDGQHQFKAIEELGRPVYFTQNPDAKLRTIALLNAFTTNWSIDNYAHFYAKQGKADYQTVIDFAEKHKTTISIAIGALTMTFHDMGPLRRDFKDGKLHITHLEEGEQMMNELFIMRPSMVDGITKDRDFFRAYVIMRSQLDFDILKNTLTLKKHLKIERKSTKKEYLRQFEDILNYEKKTNLIRLF